jgi:hypothetical protein
MDETIMPRRPMVGSTISHYQIRDTLGGGGMGGGDGMIT